ncbi:transposase [Hahella sp. CCB-MM4]|uniref:transposase n=1 Tax=Hahella sp. (strain CCB-MM4) TaxID=1926491 RepID=UPI000B9AE49D|nr:transposase [Hahella sp. CCB-MM4]OZG73033.1 transposase [Hahella sp. CCB-MM4]
MTLARKELISLTDTRYYHCIARCVRRAFLCGHDEFSGRSFEHRRQWIVDRLFLLSEIFAIDVVAYAVMSNHYHVVLKVNPDRVNQWSMDEVIERWCRLFGGNPLVARYRQGEKLDVGSQLRVAEYASEWRERLKSISWFMRCLNEHIARKANEEDECKGRFWEGRFKSQALLDDAALLTCMVYVDLNPIRAGIAKLPETSDYTSIQERIDHLSSPNRISRLVEMIGHERQDSHQEGVHFHIQDYLVLVDWTGRAIREDKRGAVPDYFPPILRRLNIDQNEWRDGVRFFEHRFPRLAGRLEKMELAISQLGQKWCHGRRHAWRLFAT